jgi:hypothetical protein
LPFLPLFHVYFDRRSVLNAAFKPVCRPWQLDVSCYGWQKRQDRGKKRQQSGNVGGKNGKVSPRFGHVHGILLVVASGRWCGVCPRYAIVQVRARLGGRALIELIYREGSGMSRGVDADCRMIPLRTDVSSFVGAPA